MASIAKQLMDIFDSRSRDLLDGAVLESSAIEESMLWSSMESMVNNIHHGEHNPVWLSRFQSIVEDQRDEESNGDLLPVYAEVLELIEIALDS